MRGVQLEDSALPVSSTRNRRAIDVSCRIEGHICPRVCAIAPGKAVQDRFRPTACRWTYHVYAAYAVSTATLCCAVEIARIVDGQARVGSAPVRCTSERINSDLCP